MENLPVGDTPETYTLCKQVVEELVEYLHVWFW